MKSWDDVMDHLARLPAWQQYAIQQRLQDAVKTEAQLLHYGVHTAPDGAIFSIRKSKT